MAKSEMGKSDLIREYLTSNPGHTWKDAEKSLKKHGINGNYFSMVKSKMNQPKTQGKKTQGKKTKRAASSSVDQTVEFARSCGSIDEAISKLKELQKYQV